MTEELNALRASADRYARSKAAADADREQVITDVVAALRAKERPTDVATAARLTPAYVRRIARDHDIAPAAPGPKPPRAEPPAE